MPAICVFDHAHKSYFNCAKDAVYGDGAFLEGAEYTELQNLLNTEIRTNVHLVQWSDDAPDDVREIDILSQASFRRCNAKWLKFTNMGLGRLQVVLERHYGTMREPSD